MRRRRWVAVMLAGALWPACAFGQASIKGVVYDDNGKPFADAPILLTNEATGSRAQTRSLSDGTYRVANLDPGTYRLSISMPCCALESFMEKGIDIPATEVVTFDVHLEQGTSLKTYGDDPATVAEVVKERQQIPDAPVPKTAAGKPDLSGVWLIGNDEFPVDPKPLEWADKIGKERIANSFRDHPHTRCLPGDLPIPSGGSPFIAKIVQKDDLMVILFEDVPGFRQVFLDGRGHPADPNPSWMGHSIGRWQGDTLVVDTTGFNGRGWVGPYPSSESLHMTEKYRRSAYGVMQLEVTFEDPTVFAEPWVQHFQLDLAPQEELIEYVCENNKWAPADRD